MNIVTEQYADIIETARKLVEADTTVTRYGAAPPAEGWCVGGACRGFVYSETAPRMGLIQTVARWIQAQPSHVLHFGSWREGGRIYFDGVDIVLDEVKALALARERGEAAIYDLATGLTVYTSEAVAA